MTDVKLNIDVNSKECIICFEQNEMVDLSCSHSMCIFCYEKLLNQDNFKCPICRTIIESSENQKINVTQQCINSEWCHRHNYKIFYATLSISISVCIIYFSTKIS